MNLSPAGVSLIDRNGQSSVELPSQLAEQLRGGGRAVSAPDERLPDMGKSLYVQTHSSDYGFPEQVALSCAFASWIRNRSYRNPAIADFNDGLAHVQVIAAVEQSRVEKRWIDIR